MPASRSRIMMDLTANGQVLTGTWTEETNPSGYYQGAVYHGAIQLLIEPTGRKMTGKWVGFGRDFDLNTGPWNLELVTNSVTDETMAEYSKPVDGDLPSRIICQQYGNSVLGTASPRLLRPRSAIRGRGHCRSRWSPG
jgi:hypothetical protein